MFSDYNRYGAISDKRVVLLQSGGLDSNICAAIMKYHGFEIHHVFVDYGQNSVNNERAMVEKIVKRYGGTLHSCKIELPWLKEASVLIGGKVEDWEADGALNTLDTGVYVPMRNLMLLSIASSLAESLQIPNICAALDGVQDFDGVPLGGTTDKHPSFIRKVESAITEGSELHHVYGGKYTILTPLMGRCKSEGVLIGKKFFADMSISWSCYNSSEVPCGECSACRARAQGFYYAGLKDPLLEKLGIEIDPETIIDPDIGPNPIDFVV